jgi:hypothetical protein
VIFSRAQTSTSLPKGCHGKRSQPFSGMRANQRTGSVDGRPEAGAQKAGRQQQRTTRNHRCNLSVTRTRLSSRRPGGAHSSPRESGWAQTDALFLTCITFVSRTIPDLGPISCAVSTRDSQPIKALLHQWGDISHCVARPACIPLMTLPARTGCAVHDITYCRVRQAFLRYVRLGTQARGRL